MAVFQNILFVREQTTGQDSALESIVVLAIRNRSKLTILDVIPPGPDGGQEAASSRMACLEALIAPYHTELSTHAVVRVGTPYEEVLRAVLTNGHDLVVKPAENPSFPKRVYRSTDLRLLRECPCPVWLLKSGNQSRYNCVLAAIDFDPMNPTASEALNLEILEHAILFAITYSASLHIMHAWEPFAIGTIISRAGIAPKSISNYINKERALHKKIMDMLAQAIRDRVGPDMYNRLTVRFHLPKGPAKTMIFTLAMGLSANLVVMGTVARTGIPGLIIGNTAEAILNQLTCSVLAVKPPGFTTPVKIDT
jgi:universal stress protein E